MSSSAQILQGNLEGLSIPSLENETTFFFGLCYFVGYSLEGTVFFLFFLFLSMGFSVYCTNFTMVVGRVVDLVEGSTGIWEMWLLSCFTTAPEVAPIIPLACALGCWVEGALELQGALVITSYRVPDCKYIRSKCWARWMDWCYVTAPPKVTSLAIWGSRDLHNQSTKR